MGILFLGKNKKMAVRGREGSRVRERQDLETTLNVFSHLNMQAASRRRREVVPERSVCYTSYPKILLIQHSKTSQEHNIQQNVQMVNCIERVCCL